MKCNEPDHLFGQRFSCLCGRVHDVQIKEFLYAKDAIEQLPSMSSRLGMGKRVALLMDRRTRDVAGAEASVILSREGWQVQDVLVQDRPAGGWPVCDDVTKQELETEIGEVAWILTVGSGVITDIGKWIAADRNIPFLSFATAASMNAYASASVAPTIGGVKTGLWARPPLAVLSSTSILCEAPYELTTAGLGDVLAKTVSITDWYLNHLLFGDYFCDQSADLITEIEPIYLEHPEGLRKRIPESIDALFYALMLTGVAMTMAETTSPASGAEHMLSHALDMMSAKDGSEHDLHGRQVGIGTVLTSALYTRVLAVESPRFLEPEKDSDMAFWKPYGEQAAENFARKKEKLERARETLSKGGAWDQLRAKLASRIRPPETIHKCLSLANAATRAEHIRCSKAHLADAFRHAYIIRPRFTILDLAALIGLMPAVAGELVESWA
jgi:glycerol-1-phosphate dehydrogenase [NAD(P)+]